MKRKDLEALIHIANPTQSTEGWKKKELRALLAHSIHHLKYRADHPNTTNATGKSTLIQAADEYTDEATAATNAIIDIFINRKLLNPAR